MELGSDFTKFSVILQIDKIHKIRVKLFEFILPHKPFIK